MNIFFFEKDEKLDVRECPYFGENKICLIARNVFSFFFLMLISFSVRLLHANTYSCNVDNI